MTPRLTAATMDPAFRSFHARLYFDTRIEPITFADWIRTNLDWLRAYYRQSDECLYPLESPVYDRAIMGAWLRLEFTQRLSAMA